MTADQVKRNLSWLLPPELDKIHKKRYAPSPVKRVTIQVDFINSKLRGHYNYCGLPGNSKKLGRLHYETIRFWKRCLSKRSQRNPDNWDWFNEKMLKVWPLVPPRLKWRYDNFSSLAVL